MLFCVNQKQRENLAKYLYDLSKIIFATVVIGKLLDPRAFSLLIWGVGAFVSWMLLEWGYALDGVRGKDES